MRLPVVKGVIERRLLVNFRVDQRAIRRILPDPFEPKLVNGQAIAGICLIRLGRIRPRGLPSWTGVGSENAAHRIAVTWREGGNVREGVFIPRRDTSSRFNAAVGGRLFPGVHQHAKFDVREEDGFYHVGFTSDDGKAHVLVEGCVTDRLPKTSAFQSLGEASSFFKGGSIGYSPGAGNRLDGLELRTFRWQVEPLEVTRVESSFFSNPDLFSPGTTQFDCALVMRDIEHEWHGL